MNNRILIVGSINNYCLETSYAHAAKSLGYVVNRYDPKIEIQKHIRFGKLGLKLHQLNPVETWIKKMNRDFIIKCKAFDPAIILFFANTNIQAGSLITIKNILPETKFVEIWPDTPMNLEQTLLHCAPLFDLMACYSFTTIKHFQKLEFDKVTWIPLAGDAKLHGMEPNNIIFDCDVSFVGMWRPERELAIKAIVDNFPDINFNLYGVYWKRNCTDSLIMRNWKGEALFGHEMAKCFSSSRVNINIIDDTNYPAANMRFFEIPTAGGLQLCSNCPEFENDLIDEEHLLYFDNPKTLLHKITWALDNPSACTRIRNTAYEKINDDHQYVNRFQTILKELNFIGS